MTVTVVDNLSSVPESEWNRIAGSDEYSPFLEHEFLCSLEESGAASPAQGWYPRHLVLRDKGRMLAAAPLYGKTHSMGEFVFDQGLAQVSEALEIPYYPKLVGTLPFTPSPGYRFLVDPDYDSDAAEILLLNAMRTLRDSGDFASLGFLFVDPSWESRLRAADSGCTRSGIEGLREKKPDSHADTVFPASLQRWAHQYFLWENSGYSSFDDYLSRFRKNQRRNIRKERRSIEEAGIEIRIISGSNLNKRLMDRMYDFYEGTNNNFGPWAAFFLNRDWFHLIGRRWSHRVLIFAAYRPGDIEPVAMSFLIKKGNTLTGRYWGAGSFVRNLHFELCYYAPIDYAIKEKLSFFDPGMGSPHKARRGFGSREFGSFHDFSDSRMAMLFGSLMDDANRAEQEMIKKLDSGVPWKR